MGLETWEVLAGLTVVLVVIGIAVAVTGVGDSPTVLLWVPVLLAAMYLGYWVGQRLGGN